MKVVSNMFKILLIISVIVSIICLCGVVACLFATSKENSLPGIEDIDLVELLTSKKQNA